MKRAPGKSMKTDVRPVPDGLHAVTPYLILRHAAQAIEFYQRAFGARERYRLDMPDGRIGHAEITIGDSILMLADEFPESGIQSPQTLNGSPVSFAIYVDNADAAFQRALDAGATVVEPLTNKFYGDRAGRVVDPYGYKWTLTTHVEDVSPEEMKLRLHKLFSGGPPEKQGA